MTRDYYGNYCFDDYEEYKAFCEANVEQVNPYDRYSYAELVNKMWSKGADQSDVNTLAEWLFRYGRDWNGLEVIDDDSGFSFRPVTACYMVDGDPEEITTIRWEETI